MFLNPFFLYILTWLGTFLLYKLEIATLYPKLSKELLFFIFFTIFINIILALIYNIKLKKYNKLNMIGKKYFRIYIFIILYMIIEFIYVGKIPLIETILKTGYTYKDFKGIKTLHVIMYTYNYYIVFCAFNDFMYTKKKKYLFYTFLGFSYYILIYSRGAVLILSMCIFLIWLFHKYSLKIILKIGICIIMFLYIFGITGNIRHYYKWDDTRMIKRIAKVEIEKNILDPFIWSYVYITSPLGNLQYNLNNSKPTYDINSFIGDNLLFDFMSKRINYKKNLPKLMIQNLTVSTVYIYPFLSYGNIGMFLIFLFYTFFEIIYLQILKKTKYYFIGVVLISVLNIFSIFTNMFVFSGLSFCLVYPLFDIFKDKIKRLITKN